MEKTNEQPQEIEVITPEEIRNNDVINYEIGVTQSSDLIKGYTITDTQNILQSKRFVKGGIEYKSPLEILEPCIKLLSTTGGNLHLTADKEQSNANQDSSINRSFARLNLVSHYEIDSEMFYEIGVLIAYDLQIPRVKVYRGIKVAACTNLCIFKSDDMVKFDISAGINEEQVQAFIIGLTEQIAEARRIVQRLKALPITPETMQNIIGRMMLGTKEQNLMNGTTSILRAVDLLTDSKSRYYYQQRDFNAWQLFNSFTEYFGEKVNAFDIPEKTRDTFHLLKGICLQ
jgi:hypothetical protein